MSAAAAIVSSNVKDSEGDEQHLPKLVVLPLRYSKVLHLIRHGEGFHNVAGHANHELYKSWDYFDAHLTDMGWEQAHTLGAQMREGSTAVDLVVVSPLTRALETAVGVFGTEKWIDGHPSPPLMIAQEQLDGTRTTHHAVSTTGTPPFMAYELCREQLGVHPCDKRRPLAHYRTNFPAVDFSHVQEEEDILWSADCRESKPEVERRGLAFMRWVLQRPERNIAVVTHSGFLSGMLRNFGQDGSEHVKAELHKWFMNCELRSIVVADVQV